MTLGSESFAAALELAGERLDALVHVHVVLVAVLLEELSIALFAGELGFLVSLAES